MAITVTKVRSPESQTVVAFNITVSFSSLKDFREAISRACNTWDNASAEMKYFHDDIVNDRALQNYNALENKKV